MIIMYMNVFRRLWYEGQLMGIRVKDEKSPTYIDFDICTWEKMIDLVVFIRFMALL